MKLSKKARKKLSKCKSVYLVVCYAHWAVREFKWTGKYKDYFGDPWPIVWDYDDHNGTYEEYVKRPIYHTTTGQICTYCFSKSMAEVIAEAMELRMQAKQKELADKLSRSEKWSAYIFPQDSLPTVQE